MKERISKILSSRGVASRRKAEEMIIAGRISCNGIISKLGDSADVTIDRILVDGDPLPAQGQRVYIMLNKPRGYVTTLSDEKGRRNAAQLVDCGQRVYPVGRLDMDSEGLLLFTNDGAFANALMHPSHEVKKTYIVYVEGYSDEKLEKLSVPVALDGYMIRKPEIQFINAKGGAAKIQITIHEGRNRQVRRMCAIAGMKVTRLIRTQEGALSLGNLPKGSWRYLNEDELNLLGIG